MDANDKRILYCIFQEAKDITKLDAGQLHRFSGETTPYTALQVAQINAQTILEALNDLTHGEVVNYGN